MADESGKPYIYTRTGDGGETGLLDGRRVPKHHVRIEAYGSVDELASLLGVVRAHLDGEKNAETGTGWLEERCAAVQSDLMVAAARLAAELPQQAAHLPSLPASSVARLETEMDRMNEALPRLTGFILPSGTPIGATLHLCRTVCRRAERRAWELQAEEGADESALRYLNRLSDWFFTAARYANHLRGVSDELWRA